MVAGPGRMLVVLSVAHTPTQDGLDAIVIVGSSESSVAKLEPRVLALAELVLRHEVEHAVFPHRSEPDLVDSDLRFLRYRRDGDRSFFEAVQDVLRDPTNGLRGEAWLGLLDVDEDGQDRVGLVRDMVDGHVARMTELPASVLVETARTLDEDTTCRLIQAGVRRAADPELPLRRRATMIGRSRLRPSIGLPAPTVTGCASRDSITSF